MPFEVLCCSVGGLLLLLACWLRSGHMRVALVGALMAALMTALRGAQLLGAVGYRQDDRGPAHGQHSWQPAHNAWQMRWMETTHGCAAATASAQLMLRILMRMHACAG
jgi:hypothetical protein